MIKTQNKIRDVGLLHAAYAENDRFDIIFTKGR